jgi:hypothetical protein
MYQMMGGCDRKRVAVWMVDVIVWFLDVTTICVVSTTTQSRKKFKQKVKWLIATLHGLLTVVLT